MEERMRWTVASVVVLALGVWSIWSASFKVEPDVVAVVTRDDRIVRIAEPGLRWHVPLIEQVGFVPIFRQYRQSVALETRLADGSTCRVTAHVLFNTPDARLAFAWRRKHRLSVSTNGARDDGVAYTEAARAFRSAAVSAVRTITAVAALNGAVSDWIRTYRSPVHADGSQVQGVQPVRVDCESEALADQRRRKLEPLEYGALRPFARTLARPAAGIETARHLELEEQEMLAGGGRQIRLTPLPVLYVIADDKRFIDTSGPGKSGRRNAAIRIGHIMNSQLRRAIGSLEIDALMTFDPLSVALPGTDLAEQFDRLGVRIVGRRRRQGRLQNFEEQTLRHVEADSRQRAVLGW